VGKARGLGRLGESEEGEGLSQGVRDGSRNISAPGRRRNGESSGQGALGNVEPERTGERRRGEEAEFAAGSERRWANMLESEAVMERAEESEGWSVARREGVCQSVSLEASSPGSASGGGNRPPASELGLENRSCSSNPPEPSGGSSPFGGVSGVASSDPAARRVPVPGDEEEGEGESS